ncbi:AraC family transcriptional regulator [Hymenobacter sp. UV11]|uniref:GyrI-like domain-containing protein n=1 Tax=Hymenobacter sp. UV11 TaxID=1849735 RepID=UPI00106081C1|nr:GyrI-like domain-containing protein [Hymenobacter sp. UV11]TDN40362.1 hypothetical protein A8B98_13015 [Hymenobacter sp. UV11]TFZ66636.1 AraC family transcriptional regulator [Hymenobacter sp. UV11]
MEPRIEMLVEKKLVGQHQQMSLLANTTAELWRRFMLWLKAQPFASSEERYSLQIYPPGYFQAFRAEATFEKWAAVEETLLHDVAADLETLTLPGGLYAVFLHRGPASAGSTTFRYILLEWLPTSAYLLDDRPHFEVLGKNYKNEDPASEEEIWIPIKPKLSGLDDVGR